MKCEVLERSPCSHNLSPCDFHVFGPLNKSLKRQWYNSDAQVEIVVNLLYLMFPQTAEKPFSSRVSINFLNSGTRTLMLMEILHFLNKKCFTAVHCFH